MKQINKPSAFKTCEIAIAKEELGLPVRKAANRRGAKRVVEANPLHIEYLKRAIQDLEKSGKSNLTYKEIREKALDLYKKDMDKSSVLIKYKGKIKLNMSKSEALKIVDDKGLTYEC